MATETFCNQCGEALASDDLRCGKCGADVLEESVAPAIEKDPWAEVVRRLRAATASEFEVVRELGRGGMAAVYLAREVTLDRQVAMKVMSPALMMGMGMVERFQREARTVAKLNHPNIVTVFTVRQLEDLHFFTMQFVEGRSLDHIVREVGALPIPMVRALLHTVGSALAYAHRRGVVHRDVKPGNVLVGDDGEALVTDFGIAKVTQDATGPFTQTNMLVGTPAYISPEQCYAHPATPASDQYSLGVLAYELVTGRVPFEGPTFAVMQAHTERPVPSIRAAHPECPPELEAAIFRMLAKDPAERWPTMQHALAELGAMPLAPDDPFQLALGMLASTVPATRREGLGTVMQQRETVVRQAAPPSPAEDVAPAVSTLSITAPSEQIEVGDTSTLVAVAHDASGAVLSGTLIAWSIDDATVASIDSQGGRVDALTTGTVTVTAEAGGVRQTVRLAVVPRRVAAVNISLPPGEMRVGDRIRLTARAQDKLSATLPETVHWTSAEADIVDLTEDGLLSAKAPGKALVWAEAQGVRGSARIEIAPAQVATIRIVDPPESCEVGETFVLRATPMSAKDLPLTDRVLKWSTSSKRTATVTEDGTVRAVSKGRVTLTCTCEGKSASVVLAVVAPAIVPTPVPSVESADTTIAVGDVAPAKRGRLVPIGAGALVVVVAGVFFLTRNRTPQTSNPVVQQSVAPAPQVSESTPPAAVRSAPATSAPVVTPPSAPAPVAAGDTKTKRADTHPSTTVATQRSDTTARVGRAPVDSSRAARPPAVAAVVIATAPPTVLEGARVRLEATARDTRDGVLAREIAWRSENTDVATVDNGGTVTAIKSGTATISASVDDRVSRVLVTVRAPAPVVAEAPKPAAPVVDAGAAERAIGAALASFVDSLNAQNGDGLQRMINDAPSWNQLRGLMEKGHKLTASDLQRSAPQPSDGQLVAPFTLRLVSVSSFGSRSGSTGSFEAVFAPQGSTWTLRRIRLVSRR